MYYSIPPFLVYKNEFKVLEPHKQVLNQVQSILAHYTNPLLLLNFPPHLTYLRILFTKFMSHLVLPTLTHISVTISLFLSLDNKLHEEKECLFLLTIIFLAHNKHVIKTKQTPYVLC